jgi:hypothetical protein
VAGSVIDALSYKLGAGVEEWLDLRLLPASCFLLPVQNKYSFNKQYSITRIVHNHEKCTRDIELYTPFLGMPPTARFLRVQSVMNRKSLSRQNRHKENIPFSPSLVDREYTEMHHIPP